MKMFPILFNYRMGKEIEELRAAHCVSMVVALPWPMIAQHERQAQLNHQQSLDELASRGGLSACEACAVLDGRPWREMPQAVAHRRLKDLFQDYVAAGGRVEQ